jgi:hypothetical protein
MAWLRFCTCSAEEQCWLCASRQWPGSGSVPVALKSSAGSVPVGNGLLRFCTCSAEEQCWPCASTPWPGSDSPPPGIPLAGSAAPTQTPASKNNRLKRLDQGQLHPKLEVPGPTCPSWELNPGLHGGRRAL